MNRCLTIITVVMAWLQFRSSTYRTFGSADELVPHPSVRALIARDRM